MRDAHIFPGVHAQAGSILQKHCTFLGAQAGSIMPNARIFLGVQAG
jgi:hypothetical protein